MELFVEFLLGLILWESLTKGADFVEVRVAVVGNVDAGKRYVWQAR